MLRRSTAGEVAPPAAKAGYVKELLDGDSAGPGPRQIGPEMAPSGPETAPRTGISGYFLVVGNRPFAGLFQIKTTPGAES
jgi:hypothetical protein